MQPLLRGVRSDPAPGRRAVPGRIGLPRVGRPVAAALVAGAFVAFVAFGAAAGAQDDEPDAPGAAEADDQAQDEPAPTTEPPATTDAPVTTVTPTSPDVTDDPPVPQVGGQQDPVAEEVGGDDGLDVDWGLVAVAVGLGIAALLVLWAVVASSRRRRQDARAFNRQLVEVTGQSEWIHDEGAPAVLAASSSPERLQVTWDDIRRRINDVASRASALAGQAPDKGTYEGLRGLSHALGRLTGALDTHVALHMQLAGDPAVRVALEGATETVMARREDLARVLSRFPVRV